MKKIYFLPLLFALVVPGLLFAQNIAVEGMVSDDNGAPLPGAVVVRKGTSQGGITDADGQFSLNAPEGSVLTISYLGYITQEVVVTSGSPLNITLSPEAQSLDDVVVVGYGTQRVRDMTAPITTVKGSELSRQVAANPMAALQGKIAGVQVIGSGAPGAGPTVKIRGTGSIGDYTKPLYVVDGVFVDNLDFLTSKT